MSDYKDSFVWIQKLQCPPSAYTNPVKHALCKGLFGLVWDDIAEATFPTSKINEIRKNVLLYKLTHRYSDCVIDTTKHISQLNSKDSKLKVLVATSRAIYERQNVSVKEKAQHLKELKSKCSLLKTKKDLLKMKYDQTSTQLSDVKNMRAVCRSLMPKREKELDWRKIKECQDTVASSLYTATSKREAWRKVLSILGSIDISVLWMHLYQGLSKSVDDVTGLTTTATEADNNNVIQENIEVGIAKLCGQYICAISEQMLRHTRTTKCTQEILEYIQRIESASENHRAVCDWLVLALEKRKLEVKQSALQREIDKLKDDTDRYSTILSDVKSVSSAIQDIDTEIEACIEQVRRSLYILKSASTLIKKKRDRLYQLSRKLAVSHTNKQDFKALKNDLSTEIKVFNNVLELHALRKVALEGNAASYRHVESCFSATSISINPSQYLDIASDLPLIEVPIYSLINCMKNIFRNCLYKKNLAASSAEYSDTKPFDVVQNELYDQSTLELSNISILACKRAQKDIDEFHRILRAWINQPLRELMVLQDQKVADFSYTQWTQQYILLAYETDTAK